MSGQNFIINCVECCYGLMVDVKTKLVYMDVPGQIPCYRGDAVKILMSSEMIIKIMWLIGEIRLN